MNHSDLYGSRVIAVAMACAAAALLPVVAALLIAPPAPGPGQVSMPDFRTIARADERKQAFFDYLRPVIAEVNAGIEDTRERLHRIRAMRADHGELLGRDRRWLARQAERYGVAADTPQARVDELLHRIDTVPASLALAQAAIESGWGRSRFAREGNNLYGEWCFRGGCGLVPEERGGGERHEVRAFASVGGSVRSYMHNLNSHSAYRELRAIRARAREAGREVTGLELAEGLGHYSQRGEAYVVEVRIVIHSNNLDER